MAIITYVLWILSSKIPVDPIYVPPNDLTITFPIMSTESVLRTNLENYVIFGYIFIIILVFFAQMAFPKLFKKFHLFSAIFSHIISISLSGAITNACKSYVGWPRPTLFTKCGIGYTNCTKSQLDKEFISWPSSHSTTAMSSSSFMIMFINNIFRSANSFILLISTPFIIFALYVAGSRIKDYKHHPDDVTSGLFIGFVVTYFVFCSVKKRIFRKEKPYEEILMEDVA